MEIIKHSTPEQRELDKKVAELQALENEFADCDLELATFESCAGSTAKFLPNEFMGRFLSP